MKGPNGVPFLCLSELMKGIKFTTNIIRFFFMFFNSMKNNVKKFKNPSIFKGYVCYYDKRLFERGGYQCYKRYLFLCFKLFMFQF